MPAALYLLVHPERYPSHDPGAIHMGLEHYDADVRDAVAAVGNIDLAIGTQAAEQARAADRAAVILDPYDAEDLLEAAEELGWTAPDADDLTGKLQQLADTDTDGQLQLTDGCPLNLFARVIVSGTGNIPVAAKLAASGLPDGADVLLGGYARHDCVDRARRALTRRGYATALHQRSTLPLRDEELYSYPPAPAA